MLAPKRIEDPKKYDLENVMRLADMIDFLKGKLKPFSHIAFEAVKKGIINEDEKSILYNSFIRVIKRINLFEGEFFPSDQSPTGLDRWEYRLPGDISKEKFIKRIKDYAKKHFKSKLGSLGVEKKTSVPISKFF